MHEQSAVSKTQMLPDGWQREPKSVSREQAAHSQISGLCSRSLSLWAHRNGHFGTEDASSLPSLIPLCALEARHRRDSESKQEGGR